MSKIHLRTKPVDITVKPAKLTAPVEADYIPLSVATPIGLGTEEVNLQDVGTVMQTRPRSTAEAESRVVGEEEAEILDLESDLEDEDEADLSLLQAPTALDSTVTPQDREIPTTGFLEVFRPECLECKSLIPFMKKSYKECHYKRGNTACPAASVQVVVRIPLNQIIPRWMMYEKDGDFKGVANMAAHLATKPDWYQQRVKDALTDARNGTFEY
jgi:hypothetical protein